MLDYRPLRSPTFRHLAAAFTINELGNWIADVALAILVFDRTRDPLDTAALFLVLRFLPSLVGPLLTTRLEAFPARRVLPAVHLGEALIFGLLAATAAHLLLPVVLLLIAVDGMLAIAAKALTRTATASGLLSGGLLREGNAILNFGFTAGGAIGPALAGVVVAGGGPTAALWLDAASFVAAAVILATAPALPLVSDRRETATERLRAGAETIRAQPVVRRLIVALAFIFLFNAVAIPIEVVFVQRTLHDGDVSYGFLLGSWGAGMILGGGAFAAAKNVKPSRVLVMSGLAMAAGYGGLAGSPDLVVACVFSAIGGMGNGCGSVAAINAVQEAVPITRQNAVMAVLGGLDQLMPGAGFVIGGVVTAASSPRCAYAVAGAGIALVLGVAGVVRQSHVPALTTAGEISLAKLAPSLVVTDRAVDE